MLTPKDPQKDGPFLLYNTLKGMKVLVKELLFEMPKSIVPVELDLDFEKSNKKLAVELLQDKSRELVKNFSEDVNLYEIRNQFVLIDEKERSIIYYMKWKEIFHKFINHQAASQVLVWRDKNKPYENIAKDIFFEYLLPKYKVVITDALQSPDGRTFWIRRIGNAFSLGLNVYYLSLLQTSADKTRELIKIDSVADFERLNKEKNFWGETEKFKTRKLIISSIELKS